MKFNKTINIIENSLEKFDSKERYLELIISRMDESKKLLNKVSFWLFVLIIAFFLISKSKIQGLSFPPFDKIDNLTVLVFIPSIFSIGYYYYITTWLNYINQRQVYKYLTSLIFDIEVDSKLNDYIQPFNFLALLVRYNESENENFLGCITSIFMLPIAILISFSPIIFICYSIYTNISSLELDYWQEMLSILVPILIFILIILMFIKSFVIDDFSKE